MKPDPRFKEYRTYVMASYVDWLEAAGARVVPLILGEPEEITRDKLSKLNGIFLPGGDGDFFYYGKFIYDTVKEYNDKGIHYPIWGTCIGYEDMSIW
jgi:gamma-glutamyl hydrolase